jgi:hypothetical protein
MQAGCAVLEVALDQGFDLRPAQEVVVTTPNVPLQGTTAFRARVHEPIDPFRRPRVEEAFVDLRQYRRATSAARHLFRLRQSEDVATSEAPECRSGFRSFVRLVGPIGYG